jgi:hypothetical protein
MAIIYAMSDNVCSFKITTITLAALWALKHWAPCPKGVTEKQLVNP